MSSLLIACHRHVGGVMRYATIVMVSILLSSSSAISIQTTQTAKGSIEGVVVRADSGEPVADAQVTLTMSNPIAEAMWFGGDSDAAAIFAAQAGQVSQVPPPE